MTEPRVRPVSMVAYVVSFGMLVASGVVLLYGALGLSHGMIWASVGLSAGAVVGTVVSIVAGRR